MKTILPQAGLLLCIVGCGAETQIESAPKPAAISANLVESAPSPDSHIDNSDNRGTTNRPPLFQLTEVASKKILTAMASAPGGTHLVVSVDVDDKKYCTGFHYNLGFDSNPSSEHFVMEESNGVQLAIEKDDIEFLEGTTLDFATLKSGKEGFVFRNPNENVSTPDELRDAQ